MDVQLLIAEVYRRNPLWDQKDSRHHNRYILDKMWDEVAIEVQSTRDAVRTKWKALRDSYRRELKKIPKKRSGDEGSQMISSWPHFESLSFLKDQFTARPSSGNLSGSQLPEMEIENETHLDGNETREEFPELIVDHEYITVPQTPRSGKRKKETKDPVGAALINLEEMKLRLLQNQQMAQQNDDDQNFVNSLLPHMRALPVRDKLLLRIQMQELVYKFLCDVESRQQTQTPTRISVLVENQVEQHGTRVQQDHSQLLNNSNPSSAGSYIDNNFSDKNFHPI